MHIYFQIYKYCDKCLDDFNETQVPVQVCLIIFRIILKIIQLVKKANLFLHTNKSLTNHMKYLYIYNNLLTS